MGGTAPLSHGVWRSHELNSCVAAMTVGDVCSLRERRTLAQPYETLCRRDDRNGESLRCTRADNPLAQGLRFPHDDATSAVNAPTVGLYRRPQASAAHRQHKDQGVNEGVGTRVCARVWLPTQSSRCPKSGVRSRKTEVGMRRLMVWAEGLELSAHGLKV